MISNFQDFYKEIDRITGIRRALISDLLSGLPPVSDAGKPFLNLAYGLGKAPPRDEARLELGFGTGQTTVVEILYEIRELERDGLWLASGGGDFQEDLFGIPGLFAWAEQGRAYLEKCLPFHLITDRDGTINPYGGLYRSSVQPLWNAFLLGRFARHHPDRSVILTSGPMASPGILDLTTMPDDPWIFSASKGREFFAPREDRYFQEEAAPLLLEKMHLLEIELKALLEEKSAYSSLQRIGSGFQKKYLQFTLARQDIYGSVPESLSLEIRSRLEELLEQLDPDREFFHLEDTGLDLEILLSTEGGSIRKFDKGDGLRLLTDNLSFLRGGPLLICGDTASDLPLLEEALRQKRLAGALFVTEDPDLQNRARALFPETLFLTHPEALALALGNLYD